MIAPRIDPIQTLVYGATGRVTRATIVDGRLSMRDGRWQASTSKPRAKQAQAQFDGLLARYPERTFGHPAHRGDIPAKLSLHGSKSEVS